MERVNLNSIFLFLCHKYASILDKYGCKLPCGKSSEVERVRVEMLIVNVTGGVYAANAADIIDIIGLYERALIANKNIIGDEFIIDSEDSFCK